MVALIVFQIQNTSNILFCRGTRSSMFHLVEPKLELQLTRNCILIMKWKELLDNLLNSFVNMASSAQLLMFLLPTCILVSKSRLDLDQTKYIIKGEREMAWMANEYQKFGATSFAWFASRGFIF